MQEQRRADYEAEIKAFEAETKRISAVQNSMSPEQISDIVMGTLHAARDTGDLVPPQPVPMNMGFEQGPVQ